MEPRAAHDSFEREALAVKGDFVGVFGLVGGEVACCAYRCFGEYDGERGAGRIVGYAAEVVHAENVVGESGAGWIGIVAGPGGFGGVRVGETEDLEGFKKGGKGDLEVGSRVGRGFVIIAVGVL